eukprot:gene21954-29002_t
MDDDDGLKAGFDAIVDDYKTYEDYLDNQITATDMFYLEDVELARQLVELGIRGNGEVIKREEFERRKEAAEAARQARLNKKPKKLASQGKNVEEFPLLQNQKNQEVSGYVDFGHRLKSENMEAYFERKKRLMPRPNDLSFYNWETQMSTSNPTPNFQVIADNEAGLLFKNKRDRKVINVDPRAKPGDNSTRTEVQTTEYMQVVIYDHVTRRRS